MTLALAVSAGLASCSPGPPGDGYVERIEEGRALKDESFLNSPDSPVPASRKGTLLPLAYYPISEDLAVPAELELSPDRSRLQIPTSTGRLRDYERIGTLRFSLDGQPRQLAAFSEVGQPISRLFVPFADGTSGEKPTPPAATSSSTRRPPASTSSTSTPPTTRSATTTSRYDCPFPPAENRLAIPIRAGERLPERPATEATR